MKIKAQALLLVVVLMFAMTGCGEKSIELTDDNYNDYLKFDLHAEGNTKSEGGEYYPLGYSYKNVQCYGNIEGLPQFIYTDVYVTLSVSFSASSSYFEEHDNKKYDYSIMQGREFVNLEQTIEGQVKLRADGSAEVDFSGDVKPILGSELKPDDIVINGYSVVAISGTVSPT